MRHSIRQDRIIRDVLILSASIAVAVLLVQTGAVKAIGHATENAGVMRTFIAGMFFTSVFTTAPAIVLLGEISRTQPIWLTALVGGLGALVGDLIIFWFVRDKVAADISMMFKKKRSVGRPRTQPLHTFRSWVMGIIGALIIASPLPDELGLALMGFSRLTTQIFIPISLSMNTLGVLAIALVANHV